MVNIGQVYKETWRDQFILFGEGALQTVTYVSVGQSTQDDDGNVTEPKVNYPDLKILYDNKKLDEIPGVVIEKDESGVFFPALNLPIRPEEDDYYTHSDGTSWRVTGVYPDNFEACWILKVVRLAI